MSTAFPASDGTRFVESSSLAGLGQGVWCPDCLPTPANRESINADYYINANSHICTSYVQQQHTKGVAKGYLALFPPMDHPLSYE